MHKVRALNPHIVDARVFSCVRPSSNTQHRPLPYMLFGDEDFSTEGFKHTRSVELSLLILVWNSTGCQQRTFAVEIGESHRDEHPFKSIPPTIMFFLPSSMNVSDRLERVSSSPWWSWLCSRRSDNTVTSNIHLLASAEAPHSIPVGVSIRPAPQLRRFTIVWRAAQVLLL